MNRLLLLLVVCFSLIISSVSSLRAEAAASINVLQSEGGFAGIPWGAGQEQIDKVMTEQGFSDKKILNHGNVLRYWGSYNGYSQYVVLSLWNNQFYEGTASGICQVRETLHEGEVRECFSRLATTLAGRYGPPTVKAGSEDDKAYYWTQYSNPPGKAEEINLMLAMHLPEGGLTEGSVELRLTNRRLETSFYYQKLGNLSTDDSPYVSPMTTGDHSAFSHQAASVVIVERDQPAIFWLKLIPSQAGLEQIMTARRQAGLDNSWFKKLSYILCQVAVLPDRFFINQQIYFDATGEAIADWRRTDWGNSEQPGAIVADLAQTVLPEYFKIKTHNLPSGFAGIPWGSSPEAIPGAMQDETLAKVLRIYMAYTDVSPLLGDVPQVKEDWLVFHREWGLQRGVINFDGRYYEKVLRRLTDSLGNPRWERGQELYWDLADDLRIGIDIIPAFGKLHGSLHVQNMKFAPYEKELFRHLKD